MRGINAGRGGVRALIFLGFCLLLAGCASGQGDGRVPSVALAMDGPPLFVIGEYSGMKLTGSMDRTCMAGYGKLTLQGEAPDFICGAEMDAPPGPKGRVRGMLQCGGDKKLLFSLRNLGPDQGVGIARESEHSDLMVLFYHSSEEEAVRRFPSIAADIARVKAEKE